MVDEPNPTVADVFRQMADRIDHNAASKFGGAYVIIPPGDLTVPMEVLVLDTQQDPAQFFMLLQAKIKFALDLIDRQERAQQGFGR